MEGDQKRQSKNIFYTPDVEHVLDPRGLGCVYYESMSKNKRALAQMALLAKGTHDSLLQRCIRTAIAMKIKGIQYGDVVSLCTYNHLNSCVPHIASMFVGAKIAAIDPSFSVKDACYLLRMVMPKLIFVEPESVELVENTIRELGTEMIVVVFGHTENHTPFSELIKPCNEELHFIPSQARDIQDVTVIMFSSGTTGLAKGLCHTHFSMLSSSPLAITRCKESLMFVSDSPYWNAFAITLHANILLGSARLVYRNFDFENPWKIFSFEVSSIIINVTQLMVLLNSDRPQEVSTRSLRDIITGGSSVTADQILKLRNLFPGAHVRAVYGQSEVFPLISAFDSNKPEHVRLMNQNPGSCGVAQPGLSGKIVDLETGKTLGPCQKGEVRVKANFLLSGYYNMDSSDVRDSDGWLKTGDCGYYDEDGCLYIVDRIKEMFKYRYWHIIPAVLEGVLMTHPAVLRAIVIGIPHDVDNNHPMAVIILKKSAGNVTKDEIEKYFNERVEERQRLRAGVTFVDNYPLGPSGKVRRMELKNMILSQLT